ncbi:MAG: arylesterase [Desulfobacterales bacterium]
MKNFKRNLILIPIILLIFQGCGEESSTTPQAPPVETYEGTIVAVGDSLTEGLGVEEEFAYPAVLEERLRQQGYPYQVVNAGISGETSSGTLSRIKWVLTLKPDIVILVIGANDGFRGIDPEFVKSNIRTIIKSLKEKKVIVVLAGMQIVQNLGQDYTTAFAEIYPEVARAEDVIFIPFFLTGVAADPDLNQADGIHPTAAGYQVIVDNITPSVVKAIEVHRKRRTPK